MEKFNINIIYDFKSEIRSCCFGVRLKNKHKDYGYEIRDDDILISLYNSINSPNNNNDNNNYNILIIILIIIIIILIQLN